MGDVSIIARRMEDGRVQYGWSGNGGYFKMVGSRLLCWYQRPEDVAYLFGLGQTRLIGRRGSEKGGFGRLETHALTGEAFRQGTTEREIFSGIAFIDYGYLYDADHCWYYVIPGPFRIKIPLELIDENLDESGYEFELRKTIEDIVLNYILTMYPEKAPDFGAYLEQKGCSAEEVLEGIREEGRLSAHKLYDNYREIFAWFDDWIVIKTNYANTAITGIEVRKKEETHIETCEW